MNYMYVLKSSADDKLYIGSTNDLKRRLREHNMGKSYSTSKCTSKVALPSYPHILWSNYS
jgi:predicted GIY-YIG superfamily endonuclease